MTAPLRLSGITPKVRTIRAASKAILINASITGNMRLLSPVCQSLCFRNQTDPLRVMPHDANGMPFRRSFEVPHQLLNVIVHDLSEITLIARGCRVAMGLHHPLNLLKGAGPIGRLRGGHVFVNRPFGERDALGVSNSNQSSQVAGAFFKICHPPNMRAVPRVFQPRTPPQSDCRRPKGFDCYAGKSRWLIGLSAQQKSPGPRPGASLIRK